MKLALSRRAPWIVGVLTLGLLLGIALNLSPYLRGPESWRWAYAIPGRPWLHLVPVVVVAIYGWLSLSVQRRTVHEGPTAQSMAEMRFLLLTAISIPLIQTALLFAESPDVLRPLFYRTISAGASGLFTVGSRIQALLPFLKSYPTLMPTFPVHPQRYPPGLPVLFYGMRRALEWAPGLADRIGWGLRLYQCHDLELMRLSNATISSAVLQMALPILSGAIVFPLYGLAKEVAGKRAAMLAVGLYPLVPSFAMWSARWDQFYPLITCTAWYLFYLGLVRDRPLWLSAAGLTLGFGTFLSFGLVAMALPLALSGALWALPHRERRRWRRLALGAGLFAAGLVLPWVLYQLAVGNGFLDIWRVSMSYHLGLDRDYWTWLFYHLYDFALFLGLPLAGFFALSSLQAIRRYRHPVAAFALAVSLSLVILDLSGVARGEVARVWLFLTPFPVIVAACALEEGGPRQRQRLLTLTFGLLAAQVLIFNAFLRVVTTGITDPPGLAQQYEIPEMTHSVDASFGGQVALLGYDLDTQSLRAGESLSVTVAWQALGPISHSFTVFNHLRSPSGDLIAQYDSVPLDGRVPTTCWLPGAVVVDTYQIKMPERLAPGTYELVTGLYRWETGERLPVGGPSATNDGTLLLATLPVPTEDPTGGQ